MSKTWTPVVILAAAILTPPYSHAVEYDEAAFEAQLKDKYIVRFNEGHRMAPQAVRALTHSFTRQQNLSHLTYVSLHG